VLLNSSLEETVFAFGRTVFSKVPDLHSLNLPQGEGLAVGF
jgi:hypothetical protein